MLTCVSTGTFDVAHGTTMSPVTVVTAGSNADVFVVKHDSAGNYVSHLQISGNDNDVVTSIAVDSSNNVYIGGALFGDDADFDPGVG